MENPPTRDSKTLLLNAATMVLASGSGATRALIEAGGPLNKPDQDGWTPVHVAAFRGRSECLQVGHPTSSRPY